MGIVMIIIMTEGLGGTQLDWQGVSAYELEQRGTQAQVRARREQEAQRCVFTQGLRPDPIGTGAKALDSLPKNWQ